MASTEDGSSAKGAVMHQVRRRAALRVVVAVGLLLGWGGGVRAGGRQVLAGSGDRTARLWAAATAKQLRSFAGHTDVVSSVAISGDGKQVLTGSWDRTARLWDAATGKHLRSFAGH